MFVLAQEWMDVSFIAMFISVVKVVLVPLVLGILIQRFLKPVAHVGKTSCQLFQLLRFQ